MIYLVTGASSGYGKIFADKLMEDHEVYDAQRNPRSSILDPIERLEYWKDCDMEDSRDVLKMINSFVTKKIQLDGIMFAAVRKEPCESLLLNVYDVQEHIMVNALMPLMILVYMERFGVLKKDASIMFFLDRRPLDTDHIPYKVSKVVIPQMTEVFLDLLPTSLKCTYTLLPDRKEITEDLIEETLQVFTGQKESHRLLKLT